MRVLILELQAAVSCLMWVLGPELRSSRTLCALGHGAIFLPPKLSVMNPLLGAWMSVKASPRPGNSLLGELAPFPLSAPRPLLPKLPPGSGSHYLENVFLGHLYEEVDNVLAFLAQVILEKGSQVGQMSWGVLLAPGSAAFSDTG